MVRFGGGEDVVLEKVVLPVPGGVCDVQVQTPRVPGHDDAGPHAPGQQFGAQRREEHDSVITQVTQARGTGLLIHG
jgi:hypothetical protein